MFFKTPGWAAHYRAEVWTIKADGSGKKRLYQSDCCVGLWAPPVWSPDGRMIAFSADSAGGTFVINADGSGLRMLSPSVSTLSWQVRNGAMNPKLRKAPVLRARIAVPKRSFACK